MAKPDRPRKVSQGDRSPSLTLSGIEEFEVTIATEAAKSAKLNVVRDVLRHAGHDELQSVAGWLKAVLDGFAALAFASSFGLGVLLSAVSVAVVQGALTVVGVVLGSLLPAAHIAALTATGGLLLVGAPK